MARWNMLAGASVSLAALAAVVKASRRGSTARSQVQILPAAPASDPVVWDPDFAGVLDGMLDDEAVR